MIATGPDTAKYLTRPPEYDYTTMGMVQPLSHRSVFPSAAFPHPLPGLVSLLLPLRRLAVATRFSVLHWCWGSVQGGIWNARGDGAIASWRVTLVSREMPGTLSLTGPCARRQIMMLFSMITLVFTLYTQISTIASICSVAFFCP